MKNTTYHITLDVHSRREGTALRLKQGASAHCLHLRLTEEGLSYLIDPQCTAVLAAEKPDGSVLYNACQISNGAAVYTLTGQETNTPGCIPCELRLYDQEGKLLISPTFCLLVEEAVCSDGDIVDSSPEYTALTELLRRSTSLLAEGELHRAFLHRFSLRAEAAIADRDLIAVPVVHPTGETADDMGLARIIRSEEEQARPDPEGLVDLPTVHRVNELIKAYCTSEVVEARLSEMLRNAIGGTGASFAEMDIVIGGE